MDSGSDILVSDVLSSVAMYFQQPARLKSPFGPFSHMVQRIEMTLCRKDVAKPAASPQPAKRPKASADDLHGLENFRPPKARERRVSRGRNRDSRDSRDSRSPSRPRRTRRDSRRQSRGRGARRAVRRSDSRGASENDFARRSRSPEPRRKRRPVRRVL